MKKFALASLTAAAMMAASDESCAAANGIIAIHGHGQFQENRGLNGRHEHGMTGHREFEHHGHDGTGRRESGHRGFEGPHHRFHRRQEIIIGIPFSEPPINYPPPAYIQQIPPTYIDPNTPYWYYCPDRGYYPYVRDCPTGWLQVVPNNPRR